MNSEDKISLSPWQVRCARAVSAWYMRSYYGTAQDPGVPAMFFDPGKVGAFAISQGDFESGDDDALFNLLIATTMFQRRQDVQIMRVLRGMDEANAREITNMVGLLTDASESPCDALSSNKALLSLCDLTKDPETKLGICTYSPSCACGPKRHTVWLKRYGHFGKVPTSAALMVRDAGAASLSEVYADAIARAADSSEAASLLQQTLMSAWRVSDKIAAMYLSMLCDPLLSPSGHAPWSAGIDASAFVVIDSNVDLFLKAIRYVGPMTYVKRRAFICALARRVDLTEYGLSVAYSPRLVQQAMYLFMSSTNRRALTLDCMHEDPPVCGSCPLPTRSICPTRVVS